MGLLKKDGNKLEIKMEKNSEWLIPLQMAEMQQNFGKVKKKNNWRTFFDNVFNYRKLNKKNRGNFLIKMYIKWVVLRSPYFP